MTGVFATTRPNGPVYRIGRAPDPWVWPDWSQAHADGTFGNRWDDPDGIYRVLYASSAPLGALVETLARFRPDLAVVAELAAIEGDDGDPVAAGIVPAEWFTRRVLGTAALAGVYVSIGAVQSLATLRTELAARAIHYGIDDIDTAAVRRAGPRRFTQEISRFVYAAEQADGTPFAGIQYHSRLDDGTENWAIFEPEAGAEAMFAPQSMAALDAGSDEVRRALDLLGLRIA